MTLIYSSPRFLDHETGQHPERPERLIQVTRHLERTGLAGRCRRPNWEAASFDTLSGVHDIDYVSAVEAFSKQKGGGRIEQDTVVGPESFEVARYAAGAVSDAVRRVTAGERSNALCLVRPPGHHALHSSAMGFCLFNNVAIGAHVARKECNLDRVLIVDWDVHHGNGTQDAFWNDPQVAFFSIHRWPFYPGTGDWDETGGGPGLGTVHNIPVEFGTSRKAYFTKFSGDLEKFADRFKPQLVILSAGFDSHREDPVGSLGLETEDFGPLSDVVLDVANLHCQGRLVSVLEGGYNPSRLAGCVELHLSRLLERGHSEDGDQSQQA